MSESTTPNFPPVEIGTEARPPVIVLPDPATLFARRAARFRALAPGHDLAPYLQFLADIADAQHGIVDTLPTPVLPDADAIARAVEFSMPVLPRSPFTPDAVVQETLARLLAALSAIDMPEPAHAALERLRNAEPEALAEAIRNVLDDAIPVEAIPEHVFLGAALQVHFARAAARFDAGKLAFIADGVCPVCGGSPVSSGIVGWQGSERTRFCTCSLCAARWNAVRIKCLACSSTKGIHYQQIEGADGQVKAECCDECRSYVKIMAEDEGTTLDAVADDVASLGLDILVREEGFRPAGVNLFLIGR